MLHNWGFSNFEDEFEILTVQTLWPKSDQLQFSVVHNS